MESQKRKKKTVIDLPKRLNIMSSKMVYESAGFRIDIAKAKTLNGKVIDLDLMTAKGDVVFIVAMPDKKSVILVKEWRPTWQMYNTSLVGGGVKRNATDYEAALQARHELMEELGYNCKKLKLLVKVRASNRLRQVFRIYLATGLYKEVKEPDEGEYTEAVKMQIDRAIRLMTSGKIFATSQDILGLKLAKEEVNR